MAAPLWQYLGIQIPSQPRAFWEADGHLSVDNFKSLMKACLHREGRVWGKQWSLSVCLGDQAEAPYGEGTLHSGCK